MLLVGDIGGTHARLSLVTLRGRALRHEVFDSRKYTSLEAVAGSFLGVTPPRVVAAAFGVAGPVVNGRCTATNLPWVIDARVLSRKLRIRHVTLLNDLVALALGALLVRRSKLHVLGGAGVPKHQQGNVAVIAAGTGLGEAVLVWDGSRLVPTATEGGHSDFAPRDDLEIELLQFLRARHGHVSCERVLSGDGLGAVYDFFRTAKRIAETARNTRLIEAAADRNEAIAQLGMSATSQAAARALDLFAAIYGGEAGNLALKSLAVGGVYVCGNIAVHLLSVLERGGFHRAFLDKGRLTPLMEKIPVAVVLDTDVGLAGATKVAMDMTRTAAKRG
ncbi:MAG: glucokinase [Myxococcota bacterium]|nr:glucokinase [Myxococcota bacterium]